MALSRAQITAGINSSITDPLNRQNTAAVVRAVFKLLNENFFNLEDDELSIGHITGLQTALNNITNQINDLAVADIDGLSAALEDAGGLKEWSAGAKKAGKHYTLPGQLWKVKVDLASDTVAPTVENASWQLVIDTTKKPDLKLYFPFDEVSNDDSYGRFLDQKIQISGVKNSDQISAVSYLVGFTKNTLVPAANYIALNSWIASNFSVGVSYWIIALQTPIAAGSGQGEHIISFKEIA